MALNIIKKSLKSEGRSRKYALYVSDRAPTVFDIHQLDHFNISTPACSKGIPMGPAGLRPAATSHFIGEELFSYFIKIC